MIMARLIATMTCILVLVGTASQALAQVGTWPSRPIKFIIPFAAGGPMDGAGRHITARLEKALGQPVVVENVGGQGGGIGASRLARSDPDGYTIGLVHVGTQAINPSVYPNLNYNPLTDFTSIAQVYEFTNVLVVSANKPYKSLADILKAAKENPEKISFGSSGIGSSNHLSAAMLASESGVKLVHVPYRGNAPALTDLVAGNVDFMFDVLLTSKPFIDDGKLRALAVTSRKRMSQLPDVPTVAETIPGFEVVGWAGLAGPKDLPGPIVDRLARELEEILKEQETLDRLSVWGFDTRYGTPDQLTALVRKDLALWGPIVRAAGVRLDQ
jgi:tripartite-type tricarboxylate transporter receptor subunit TctC